MTLKHILAIAFLAVSANASAQSTVGKGGITPEMLTQMRQAHPTTPADRALRNALAGTSINQLATNANNAGLHPLTPSTSDVEGFGWRGADPWGVQATLGTFKGDITVRTTAISSPPCRGGSSRSK